MKKYHTSLIGKFFIGLMLFSPCLVTNSLLEQVSGFAVKAEAAKNKDTRKTRRAQTLRKRVYDQLQFVQQAVDKNDNNKALEILKRLESSKDQFTPYERAMVWNSFAYIYYNKNNITQAINYFNKVLNEKDIREQLELNTIFTLAQLNMQESNYKQTLTLLDRWSKVKQEKLNDKGLVLQANAYYAMKDYSNALKSIDSVIEYAFAQNEQPKENWLVLKRALHFELKQPKKVAEVCEELVRRFPEKGKYWVELGNMYGELTEERKQLAVMEAAHNQGFISRKSEVESLAQLYYFSGAPYKAANLMSEFLDKGVLNKDVKTLKFLAQAWVTAKENDKAIPVLKQAAAISTDGNMHAELAQVLVSLERWQEAISVAQDAKQKGGLQNPGNVEVTMGMAYFNQKKFDQAIDYFEKAQQHDKVKKIANQWLAYAKSEKRKEEQHKQLLSAVGNSAEGLSES